MYRATGHCTLSSGCMRSALAPRQPLSRGFTSLGLRWGRSRGRWGSVRLALAARHHSLWGLGFDNIVICEIWCEKPVGGLKGRRGIEMRLRFRVVNFPVPPNDFLRVRNSLKTDCIAESTGKRVGAGVVELVIHTTYPPPLTPC